jgi:hypothetical protein
MTVKNLMSMLESFDDDSEIVIEITKNDASTIVTYAIGFNLSEFGELMLQIHE